MRAIVCGGRDFKNWPLIKATLDAIHAETPLARVATGAAPGADTLADTWARSRAIRVERYYALWHTYGNAAGPMRNQKMLDDEQPDIVIAFPGGHGTEDMVSKAEARGVLVRRIQPHPIAA